MKYIFTYQGLGDLIDCNGMVRYFQKIKNQKLHVFVKARNFKLISYMYRDNPDIVLIEIPGEDEIKEVSTYLKNNAQEGFECINIGHGLDVSQMMHSSGKNCWEIFYQIAKIPDNIRYKMFYLERDHKEEDRVFQKLTNNEPYIFVHDDPSRNVNINPNTSLRIVKNDITENPFHFIKLFENAQEIHCMESSIKSIIDSYNLNGKPLYFYSLKDHPYFKGAPIGKTNNKWITV